MIRHGVRLSELDGVRAIAVGFVMLGHALLGLPEGSWWRTVLDHAAFGVDIFFVLSGFLITSLLLREQNRTGRLDLGAFYLRRVRRIVPAFAAYVAAIAALQMAGLLHIPGRYYAAALSQTWNYQVLWNHVPDASGQWYFGHYWSLALEEQFYLLWPLLLLLLPARHLPRLLLALIALMPVMRVLWYVAFPAHRGSLGMFFHTACDPMLLGALLAFTLRQPPPWLVRITASRGWRVALLILALALQPLAAARWQGAWTLPLGISLNALCAAYLIALLRLHQDWHAFFASRPLAFVGGISYSLYLWQQLFLAPAFAQGLQFPLWLALPALLLTAWLSWRFIERPFLARPAATAESSRVAT